jgi:hypothetical protein
MTRKAVFMLLLLLGPLVITGTAAAHSTAGRVKVDLQGKAPGVDDFAYFMESYVHRELYRGRFEQWEKRFYVKEFTAVQHLGDRAVVRFVTLDHKENEDFADEMGFSRSRDGRWWYVPKSGDKVAVYTYVTKWSYLYDQFILPVSATGTVLGLALLAGLVWRRRRAEKAPEGAGGAAA